jgi:predicted ATP-dependent serine protease
MIKHNETDEVLQEIIAEEKQKEEKESHYKPIPMEELLKIPPKPPVIEGLAREGEWMLITGFPKAGKTFFVLQLAYSLAEGKPFLNQFSPMRKYKVLFLSFEERKEGINLKLRALKYPSSPNLYFLFPPSLTLDYLKDCINQDKFEILIIDNLELLWLKVKKDLASYFGSNAYEVEYDRFSFIKEQLEGLGITVFITHHLNKRGQYLGTTAIAGAPDNIIEMTALQREENKQVCLIETKLRNWKEGNFYIEREEAEWQYGGEAREAKVLKAQLFILELFKEQEEMRRKVILKALEDEEFSKDVIDNALRKLVKEGKLEKPRNGLYRRRSL